MESRPTPIPGGAASGEERPPTPIPPASNKRAPKTSLVGTDGDMHDEYFPRIHAVKPQSTFQALQTIAHATGRLPCRQPSLPIQSVTGEPQALRRSFSDGRPWQKWSITEDERKPGKRKSKENNQQPQFVGNDAAIKAQMLKAWKAKLTYSEDATVKRTPEQIDACPRLGESFPEWRARRRARYACWNTPDDGKSFLSV